LREETHSRPESQSSVRQPVETVTDPCAIYIIVYCWGNVSQGDKEILNSYYPGLTVDRIAQRIEVYRRDNAQLKLVTTLVVDDVITSPLLPNFACEVARLFVSRG
jgi:hypothetical protein